MKLDGNGKPILQKVAQLSAFVRQVPQNQLPNVTKLFHLKPLPIGLLFSGAATVGDLSIKNLVDLFLSDASFAPFSATAPTVQQVADAFSQFTITRYNSAYAHLPDQFKPVLEVLLSGYSVNSLLPEVFRLTFSAKPTTQPGLNPHLDSLSEQAAINFAEFLVETMIKAQQLSGTIPTVGGDIHLAIITKANGFVWISKEEYIFRGHAVPKHHNQHAP